MSRLFSIGEVLIDFIPKEKGVPLKDVTTFERSPGGAPANVAAAVAKLGGEASLITKLGEDAFGDFLLEKLIEAKVETRTIFRTKKANTGLAFVSLRQDGERDFSFYRNPSADLLLSEDEMDEEWFSQGDILHFCSVDLVESPMKGAHLKAIKGMKDKGGIVSFDPNVRLPLWNDPEECKRTIRSFLPQAHLIKIAEDELEFVTGLKEKEQAIMSLFVGDVEVVLYTKGHAGAELFVKHNTWSSKGYGVDVMDTTGAGDAFIGGFLYKLLEAKATPKTLVALVEKHHEAWLSFSNACGALTTTKAGAISALPNEEAVVGMVTK